MVEPAQDRVLADLVALFRRARSQAGRPFAVTSQPDSFTLEVRHPSEPDTVIEVYEGDLVILEDAGYIRATQRLSLIPSAFIVTSRGAQRVTAPGSPPVPGPF